MQMLNRANLVSVTGENRILLVRDMEMSLALLPVTLNKPHACSS